MKLAAEVAKQAFGLFHSLPPQVQALAITAIAANKLSGGAVGSIAKGLGNIFAGALQTALPRFGGKIGGILGGPGSSPFNPMFVSVVGPGGLGGLGALGGRPGLGGLPFGTNNFGGGGMGGALGLGFGALAAYSLMPFAQDIGEAIGRVISGDDPGGAFENHAPRILGGDIPKTGVQTVKLANSNLFDKTGDSIDKLTEQAVNALEKGDIHAARIAANQADNLRRLIGAVNHETNTIVPHLGRTNRALAVANRNLDDGNARQRETAQRIREARHAIGTGFQRTDDGIRQTAATTHRHLSGIEAQEKATAGNTGRIAEQGPPNVNVTVPVNTTVSINDIIRSQTTYNAALSIGSQTRSGFKP